MRNITWAVIFVAALFLSLSGRGFAQELPEQVVRLIESECENGLADADELMQYFLELMRTPLNLNTAGREDLSSLIFLNRFMVESLLEYRQEYGRVMSYAELALVDGFDEATVGQLRPFVTLGNDFGPDASVRSNSAASFMERWRLLPVRNSVILKSRAVFAKEKTEAVGVPVYRYARYNISLGSRLEAGFTLESDAGEKGFPDFYSVTVRVNDIPLSRRGGYKLEGLVVGDYSLRFGQGLALWSGFAMSSLSSPASVIRSQSGMRAYTSSGEDGYFRGVAATFGFPQGFRSTVFFSAVKLDARVEGDRFVTKPEGGLHNTVKLLESKGKLGEMAGGANISWQNSFLRVGLTAVFYGYDKKDGRRKSYYNSHLRYDGMWCNVAADFLLSLRGVRVFGETALDRMGHVAAIAGVNAPLAAALEGSLLCRYYDTHYIATHAGAYSNTSCNNEYGVSAVLSYTPMRKLVLTANAAYTRYPFHRYGVKGTSDVFKGAVDCDWKVADRHSLYFKASVSVDNGRRKNAVRLRGEYAYVLPYGLETATRLEISRGGKSFGGLLFQEVRYNTPDRKFRCAVRTTLFSTEDWDARIYAYERDVPGTFSVPAWYGKGIGLYATATYRPLKWLSMSLKCSGILYEDSSKNSIKLNSLLSFTF